MSRLFLILATLFVVSSFFVADASNQIFASENEKQKFCTVPDASVPDNAENRTKFAVRMFKQACFDPFWQTGGSEKFAQTFMTNISDTPDAASFMKSVSAASAKVFYIDVTGGIQPLNNGEKVAGGNAALILEPNGKCHIVSSGADKKTLQSELQKFAEEQNQILKDQGITFHYRNEDDATQNISRGTIRVSLPNGNQIVMLGSGTDAEDHNIINAMISIVYYGPAQKH